jgi:hypothetical protein
MRDQCGAVTFIQRFGGSPKLNAHFHVLALDGVNAPGRDDQPEFFPLRAPEDKEEPGLHPRWRRVYRRWGTVRLGCGGG